MTDPRRTLPVCAFTPADWTDAQKQRALDMIFILANTPPGEWRRRSEIYAELAEFRSLP